MVLDKINNRCRAQIPLKKQEAFPLQLFGLFAFMGVLWLLWSVFLDIEVKNHPYKARHGLLTAFKKTAYRTYSGNAYLTVLKLQQMSAINASLLDAYALSPGILCLYKKPHQFKVDTSTILDS